MTFALGLSLGFALGACLTLAVICLVNDWIADPDDDPRPALPGKRGETVDYPTMQTKGDA
jgi:hypothetical protein